MLIGLMAGLMATTVALLVAVISLARRYSVASGGGGPGNRAPVFGQISSRRADKQDGLRLSNGLVGA
jgi:hypothetical protein